MSLKIILLIIIAILIFIIYMASQKIKEQDGRISHLERLLELQGKVEDGIQDIG